MASTKPVRIKSISEFHQFRGLPKPEHPLISVVDYASIKHSPDQNGMQWIFDYYSIALKRGLDGKMRYGQQQYDFDEGVMFFMAPNQVFGIETQTVSPAARSGWLLLIHPDFCGTRRWQKTSGSMSTSITRYQKRFFFPKKKKQFSTTSCRT